ncbi:MAG: hypothetical protein ACKVW3_06320 [Phycisphaerales bacterium]
MNQRTIIAIAGVAVVCVGVAALVSQQNRVPTAARAEQGSLFADLATPEGVNRVSTVSIKRSGSEFTLKKGPAGWELAERGGFPVMVDKVKELTVGLGQLRSAEAKTSKPDLYSKIGVQDLTAAKPPEAGAPDEPPATPDATGPVLLTLKDDKDAVVASVIVGNTKWEGNQQAVYLRKAGEAQSWLARGKLDVPTMVIQLVETKIVELPRERVRAATVTHADGTYAVVFRETPESEAFVIRDIPAGRTPRTPTSAEAMATALASVTLEDVKPLAEVKFSNENGTAAGPVGEWRTFDGLVVTIQMVEEGEKTWARVAASFDEASAAAEVKGGLKSADDVKKEVEAINARVARWAYLVPTWKAPSLKTKLEDLLNSLTPPPPPASMQGEGSTIIPMQPPAPTGATAPTGPAGGPG